MSGDSMSTTTEILTATSSLVALLEPLDAADRRKVITAALTVLGDVVEPAAKPNIDNAEDGGGDSELPPKAKVWMKQNSLSQAQLDHVFHIEDESVHVIASEIPGKGLKEKTINAFVLTGVSKLLQTGEAKFDDKLARDICKTAGCYSNPNHSTYMKDKGNVLSGSKNTGWALTAPGLKAGADLVKEIAGS
jgi:predicted XRE-type DNA-binding protein